MNCYTIKINKTNLSTITPPSKGYTLYWDTELKGFGYRITSNGACSFILQFRIKGISKRMTLGRHPDISPKIAHNEALKLLSSVASGGDPVASKKREKLELISLSRAFDDYITTKDLKPELTDQNFGPSGRIC